MPCTTVLTPARPFSSSCSRELFVQKGTRGCCTIVAAAPIESFSGLNPAPIAFAVLMAIGIPSGTFVLNSRAEIACNELEALGYEYKDLLDENFTGVVSKRAAIAKARLAEAKARKDCEARNIDADELVGEFVAELSAQEHASRAQELQNVLTAKAKSS